MVYQRENRFQAIDPVRVNLDALELGGERGQWCGLVRGPAIADAVEADRFATAGTIVASSTVWRHLRDVAEVTSLPGGHVRLDMLRPVEPFEPATAIELADSPDGAALPDMIAHRGAGGGLDRWSGEFRTCHIVFGRLECAGADAAVDQLHLAVAAIQRELDRSHGSLYQLVSDEKGLALVAAYGLPPRASGTDGTRALEATMLIKEALAPLGIGTRFGIAVGRVFCTTYGTDRQLHFALVGSALNRAARLADAPDGISVDTAIVEAGLPPGVVAAARPPASLKGFTDPVAVSVIARGDERQPAFAGNAAGLVGRATELAHGLDRIAGLAKGDGGLLVIEGEPGAGKSTFAASLAASAAARSLPTARGGANEIDRAAEYHPWRQVLSDLLASAIDGNGQLADAARDSLGANRAYAGLLSRLLDIAPGADDTAARLTDEARATLVRQMTVDLLAARSAGAPFLLVLEDLHWFDSQSLALLEALLDARLPILVLATTRIDDRIGDLMDGPGRERMALGGLDAQQAAALLAQTCGSASTDDALAARVHKITNGNPLFITQLGRFLLDNGGLQTIGGQLVAVDETLSLERAFEAHGVPATLEGVVMGRLDALPALQRETVRVASVLGGTFAGADLTALLGSASDLAPLIAAGILSPRNAATIDFRHAILRDVAYSTLSLADRRRLHRAVARLMASKPEAATGQLDAALAYHLEQAGEVEPALAYGLKAGRSLLRGNANREALAQHAHGLELFATLPANRRTALHETEIELQLGAGEAAQRLSLYDVAVAHKDTALAALGGAIPAGGATVPALLREVAEQVVRRCAPWLMRRPPPNPRDLRLSAETAELVEIYFYRGESLRSLYAALRALNLAEGGGDTAQLARGFGIVGTIAGFARLSGVAQSYGDQALDVLSRIDDPAASWWVPLVVGVSRLSAGDLAAASRLMDMTAAAAERIRDRRHWRDAIGNQSIILGLRGDWNAGLALSEQYGATALEDRDVRYVVGAAREQAYYLLQLGRLDEAERSLARVRAEVERGLKAEEAASRQDLHAIAAAIALARGDGVAARREAEAGYAVLLGNGSSSFPNMFWSLSLLFEAFSRLADGNPHRDQDRAKAWALVRALDKHAASHRIGRPAALRARGLYEQRFGWAVRAGRWLDRAAESARALGMAYGTEPAGVKGPDLTLARLLPPWLRRGPSSR
jgi:hypothetical protein